MLQLFSAQFSANDEINVELSINLPFRHARKDVIEGIWTASALEATCYRNFHDDLPTDEWSECNPLLCFKNF